ncbi:hypothetical protein ACROYT_G014192 [Oculina patagonica]
MNTDWIVEVCLCDRYPSSARAMRDTQNNQKADEHLKSSLTLVQCTSDGVKTSESPTQAYLVLVIWLYKKFKALQDAGKSAEDIKKAMGATCLAYDMCHVDSLRLAKKDLPFPAPFNQAWKLVSKVIDRLHLRNHKDPACKRLYNAEDKLPSQYNTMACEQTFVWASRLKKVICAMPRLHQFFFLHRSVKQRNTYTQRCHQNNKTPVLPKLAKVDR